MRQCLCSLFQTAKEAEIIVVDNGGNSFDTNWLVARNESEDIACYVRNRKNMHFGYARNQGLKLATGEYIVICDNDILFTEGWMEECVSFLENHPGKYIATPIAADPMNMRGVRWAGEVDGWKLNWRAGSNVFMMRRKDFELFGYFEQHRIAGSKFADRTTRLGYTYALMPKPKAFDLGFRQGYNLNEHIKNLEL